MCFYYEELFNSCDIVMLNIKCIMNSSAPCESEPAVCHVSAVPGLQAEFPLRV